MSMRRFFLIVVTLYTSSIMAQINFINGTVHRDTASFPKEQKIKIWDLEDIAYNTGNTEMDSIIAYVAASSDAYYFLDRSLVVGSINEATNSITGKWPLTPWPNHLFLAGEYDASAEEGSNIRGEDFILPNDPLQIITTRIASYYTYPNRRMPGCLRQIPLRYGDIDSDGLSELAIFLGSTVIFFSPQSGKVSFSYHYQLNDEMTTEEAASVFLPPYHDTDPQYIAGSGRDNLVRKIFPAQRSLSKIYIQDFNGDNISDIVLWRKIYRSNLRDNSTEGFHLLAETWIHYQLTDGEYRPQATNPTVIQSWLTAQNLTWQSGYPSHSECAGEEGQLIPEMHDPLLNDPDVLR